MQFIQLHCSTTQFFGAWSPYIYTFALAEETQTTIGNAWMLQMLRVYGKYITPCSSYICKLSSATGRAYTTLRQIECPVVNFGTMVGGDPSCYVILALQAVNRRSIVCWVVLQWSQYYVIKWVKMESEITQVDQKCKMSGHFTALP